MDGNRRWAKKEGLLDFKGHRAGYEKVKEALGWCREEGIKILTLYAFSNENWRRSKREVGYLMRLFALALTKNIQDLHASGIKLKVIGRTEKLPFFMQCKIREAELLTENCKAVTLVLAISYGGRDEIIRAVKEAIIFNGVDPADITEEKIRTCLDTDGLPDPDLIIRTGGEMRLSNFLAWQSVYSELYFTKIYWPDFSREEFNKALADYALRKRNYGQ